MEFIGLDKAPQPPLLSLESRLLPRGLGFENPLFKEALRTP